MTRSIISCDGGYNSKPSSCDDGQSMKTRNHILDYMLREGLPLTVKTYIQLDTLSETSKIEELTPESRAEVQKLIALGWLHDTDAEVVQ